MPPENVNCKRAPPVGCAESRTTLIVVAAIAGEIVASEAKEIERNSADSRSDTGTDMILRIAPAEHGTSPQRPPDKNLWLL